MSGHKQSFVHQKQNKAVSLRSAMAVDVTAAKSLLDLGPLDRCSLSQVLQEWLQRDDGGNVYPLSA